MTQGLSLSPYLLEIYDLDVFCPRVSTRMLIASITLSYVDDRMVLATTNSVMSSKEEPELRRGYNECSKVAKKRGGGFSSSKVNWMGIGKEDWGNLVMDRQVKRMVREIRILGYKLDCDGKMGKHMEYWVERGVDVGRRIAAIGRRYRSQRGIGS